MSQAPAHLLLTAEDQPTKPWLDGGCQPGVSAADAARGPTYKLKNLRDLSGDANHLDRQKWAVVVADTPAADRLVKLIEPLMSLRSNQQRKPVLVIKVPAGQTELEAQRWRLEKFPPLYRRVEADRPRYLLILGDFDGVSLATQQVLAMDGFPGRLVGDCDADYQAYAAKVVAHETAPQQQFERGRCLLYTVHDGTAATRSAHEQLITTCHTHLSRDLPGHTVGLAGATLDPDLDEFLQLAGQPQPTVMFSVSHGLGPPRGRAWTPTQAQQRQGAMSFGRNGHLEARDFDRQLFIPGGLWVYFACYGAGTPHSSHFLPWIDLLARSGTPELAAFRQTLSLPGGFTSTTVKTALKNPKGPQAVLGHLDLAWSYSYESPRLLLSPQAGKQARSDRFHDMIRPVVAGGRVGTVFLHMQISLAEISKSILALTRDDQASGQVANRQTANLLGRLWLMREDLRGYVLMGDPAVRLPLADTKAQQTPQRPQAQGQVATPAQQQQAQKLEEGLLKYIAGELSKSQVQRTYGIRRRDVDAFANIYREAGRRAIAEHLAKSKA